MPDIPYSSLVEVLGSIAGTLTTIAFAPQAYRIYKTKSVEDISLTMYVILTLGIILWILYGILRHSYPLIVANGVTLFLAGGVLILKVRYSNR